MTTDYRERLPDIGLLILRLGFGLGFLWFHGWSKLIAGPEGWAGTGAAMARYGIDFWPVLWGFLAAFSESIGGILIALGLFTRVASALLAFTMLTAFIGHVVSGQGSPAHSFKNLFVALGLCFIGPGRYSIDAWWAARKRGTTK